MFLCAIVVASFGSRAAKIEQSVADVIYTPTTITTTQSTTQTTTQGETTTTISPFFVPGYWITTVPDGPFKTNSSLFTTTQPSEETTTVSPQTTDPTTSTSALTTITTTTKPTTTTSTSTTTTTKPTTTTSKPTTTTTKPTTTTTKPAVISANNVVYALLYDVTNDKILYEKNSYSRCYPASTTKLLTASVALYYMKPDDVITVGNEINMIAYDSSVCGIQKGYKMTLAQLIMGLMISSGNDAAYTIAVNVARKVSGNPNMTNQAAVEYFATLMNSYAKKLGANSSNFVVPDGYHNPNHYSTPHDLLIIAKHARQIPTIQKAASTHKSEILLLNGGKMTFKNTNSLLNPESEYYYPYADGLKTGMTYSAGHCLISTATKDGRTLLAITMCSASDGGRYSDTINMFNAAF